MKRAIPIYAFFLLLSAFLVNANAAENRDVIIQQQMDQLENQIDQTFNPAPKKPTHFDYEIAPEFSFIKYNEPNFIKEFGYMDGISGSITYHPHDGDSSFHEMYRLEGMFNYGKVNYRGSTIDLNTGDITPTNVNGIQDYMVEMRGLIGADFHLFKSELLTPYIGFGYRSLYDTASSIKPGGYNRWIQYFYLPIGTDITTRLNDQWSLTTNLEYDLFILGRVTSYASTDGLGTIVNTQRKGYGLRGSLKLRKILNHYNIFFEPFVRYWNIRKSEGKTLGPFLIGSSEEFLTFVEPLNSSLELGGKLGIEF